MTRLSCHPLTPDQLARFDDLKRLIGHILTTYGLWWTLEAMIAYMQAGAAKNYETLLISNLTKTLEDYQSRYDDEPT